MTDETDTSVLLLLREIRSPQADHGKRLARIAALVEDVHASMLTGLGRAAERVERLEKKK